MRAMGEMGDVNKCASHIVGHLHSLEAKEAGSRIKESTKKNL